MSEHQCDPMLGGATGPLTQSRAMRLLLTYFHEQSLVGDAMPVLQEIGDCPHCMFAVMSTHMHFAASLLVNMPDRERDHLVALLEGQLAAALDRLAGERG